MTDRISEGLGARIKQAIQAAGMNQTKLAEALGTTSSIVNGWLNKGVVPAGRFLVQMPEILGCDANWLLSGKPYGEEGPRLEFVVSRLTELLDELGRDAGSPGSPPPLKTQDVKGPKALKERFLAAIHDFTDLQVEEICGINHETVRQYRKDDWPERGPNRASTVKVLAMIKRYEAILEESSIIAREKIPQQAAGLIKLAEFLQHEPSFAKKHPKLGWISFADAMAKEHRKLGELTIYDELIWLGYKIANHFDPETASRVTLEDVDMDVDELASATLLYPR